MNSRQIVSRRNQNGITLVLIGALLLLACTILGFFTAELWHAFVVRQQLRNVCDASGLATAAALASSNYPTLIRNTTSILNPANSTNQLPTTFESRTARQTAAQIGFELFRQNTICGHRLATTDTVLVNTLNEFSNRQKRLKPGDTVAVISFYDSTPTGPKSTPDPINGKHIQVQAATCVTPLFAISILGDKTVITAVGRSASAQIDMAFMLDTALRLGSETNMYIVQRCLNFGKVGNKSNGSNNLPFTYWPPQQMQNPLWGQSAQKDTILPTTDRPTAAVAPQYIDNNNATNFDPLLRGAASQVGLPAGVFNTGVVPLPPNDTNPPNPPAWSDAIVMPSGSDTVNTAVPYTAATDVLGTLSTPIIWTMQTGPYQGEKYRFPNIATLVEASRGNLDGRTEFFTKYKMSSFMPNRYPTPKAGYQAAYEAYAIANTEPYHTECVQISNLFTLLNANTDSHISITPYSQNPGTPQGTMTEWDVGNRYSQSPYEVTQDPYFPFAQVPLEYDDDPNMIQNLYNALVGYHLQIASWANLGMAAGDAQLTNPTNSRPTAKKIATLLSDGEPTNDSAPWPLSQSAASGFAQNAIPLYPIAFLHPASIAAEGTGSEQYQFMSTMATAAGPGSQAFMQTEANMAVLQQIFRVTSHQLVTLE